jgi:AcrR family transcriptional regulator
VAPTKSSARPSTERSAPASRSEGKEQTRQALLGACLKLLAKHSFDSISLREVTREAGVSPTAFYRHFEDMEELGMVLVEDSLSTVRQMLREARTVSDGEMQFTDSIKTMVAFTLDHEMQLRFVARERHGGVRRLRRLIRSEIALGVEELAIDLALYGPTSHWPLDDRLVLAGALSEAVILMAFELPEASAADRQEIIRQTERRMLLIMVGAGAWRPRGRR